MPHPVALHSAFLHQSPIFCAQFCHFLSPLLPAMASAAALASASHPLLGKSSFGGRHGSFGASSGASLPRFNLTRARRSVVAATDNVEQRQQEVLQEALQDTMLNATDPQKPLSSREGLEERFAVINTGAYECRSCGHVYEEQKGDSTYPVAAGTLFQDLPEDWLCPTCGAAKSYYQTKSVEVAGFAQNQQYGFGGNSLTGGQKSLLIYGSLLFFFTLFLSGYFLQ